MDLDEHTHDELTPEHDHYLRATIAAGRITLNPPLHGTITGGPASMTLARLDGVVLVDLRHAGEDDEELVATVPPNAPPITTAARRTLADWAAVVGYRRLWLPDRVLELEPPDALGTAEVRCPTCTATWADGSPRFWSTVRANGHFPGYCPACGGSLPEWRTVARRRTRGRRHGAAARPRAAADSAM
jgi:hypothetical protein